MASPDNHLEAQQSSDPKADDPSAVGAESAAGAKESGKGSVEQALAHDLRVDTSGNPYKLVLRIAIPTVIAMLSQNVVNLIDIFYFGWLPEAEGATAQAALTPSLILVWLFGGSLSAIGVGTQAIAARRFAEGKLEASGAALLNSWIFALIASVIATIIAYSVTPLVLEAYIGVESTRVAARSFLNWRLLGITSMVLTFSFKAFFDGLGKTYVHLVSALIMNAINVFLCWVLIFGKLGAPKLGIEGAGMADAFSTWIGLAIMVAWVAKSKYRKVFHPFTVRKASKKVTMGILRISVPSSIATLAVATGFVLFSYIVNKLDSIETAKLGTDVSENGAATSVIVTILMVTFTACLAFGTSTATLVSQSLGERKPDQAARFGWVSVRLGLVVFGVLGFCEGVLFPEEVLRFFSPSDAVVQAALGPMRLMGICTPLIAVGMILTQALFGAGDSKFVMVVELILHFTCLVPLAWLLGVTLNLGIVGVWSAAATYIVLLSTIMVWKFKQGTWKTHEV